MRNRLASDSERLVDQLFDDEGEAIDIEPTPGLDAAGTLNTLIEQADRLRKSRDPKVMALVEILEPLIASALRLGALESMVLTN